MRRKQITAITLVVGAATTLLAQVSQAQGTGSFCDTLRRAVGASDIRSIGIQMTGARCAYEEPGAYTCEWRFQNEQAAQGAYSRLINGVAACFPNSPPEKGNQYTSFDVGNDDKFIQIDNPISGMIDLFVSKY